MRKTNDNRGGERFSRTVSLIGEQNAAKLRDAKVIVFGLGGVGGYVTEALVRGGVGSVDVVDGDAVDVTNINRQIYALDDTVGKKKTEIAAARSKKINPEINMQAFDMFYLPENADAIDLCKYDYVVDAIDTVTAKIELAVRCDKLGVPVIAAMGTGNKLDPTKFKAADIYETSICPLCRVMRRELKKRGVQRLKVVYSTEEPITNANPPASISFCPPVAGFIIAAEVIKDLIKV